MFGQFDLENLKIFFKTFKKQSVFDLLRKLPFSWRNYGINLKTCE